MNSGCWLNHSQRCSITSPTFSEIMRSFSGLLSIASDVCSTCATRTARGWGRPVCAGNFWPHCDRCSMDLLYVLDHAEVASVSQFSVGFVRIMKYVEYCRHTHTPPTGSILWHLVAEPIRLHLHRLESTFRSEIIRSPRLRGELWAGWIRILVSMQAVLLGHGIYKDKYNNDLNFKASACLCPLLLPCTHHSLL